MIKKSVDGNGTVILTDGGAEIASIATKLEIENSTAKLTLKGVLRTDTQVYLGTEFQFYEAAGLAMLEIDCGGVTAIAPGCFRVMLDLKIKMTQNGRQAIFLNKPDCIAAMERKTGKTL